MADIREIRMGEEMSTRRRIALTTKLAVPAILAQLSTILMQYIDASMVGQLGADDSAAVGLMNSSLWMFTGVCTNMTMGFSVQVAHRLGGNNYEGAKDVFRQGITASFLFGLLLAVIGMLISGKLPIWLGGNEKIAGGATTYFFVFVAAMPILAINYLAGGVLRCAGNMKVSGILSVAMCVMDVLFNFYLIFPTRNIHVFGTAIMMPGAGMGILGAAIGTVAAESITALAMLWYACRRQPEIALKGRQRLREFIPRCEILKRGSKISVPMMLEHIIFCGAQIMITVIVAPLGVIAIAANAFAVTAESLCYMPGFGIGEAATTLCGQCYGANRYDLVKGFCYLTTMVGVGVMTIMGLIMYVCAPYMMEIMTPIEGIKELGTEVLRIEAWAEPMYAASIVAYGAFVGVGDTVIPAIMNFGSMWLVRIPLAALMAPTMGLRGVWIAMCVELTMRGVIFLWRMATGKWLKRGRTPEKPDVLPEV